MERRKNEMRSIDGVPGPECPVYVSVILPAYNEAENIEGIYAQVIDVFGRQDYSFEILFIDDGSTDDTWPRIMALAEVDPRVRAMRHRRNSGKASALANGFAFARGEIMLTSDADMQYEPEDMVRMVRKIEEGYDIVSAYKVVRRDSLERRLPSKFFNYFIRKTTGIQMHDMNAGLKAFRYEAAEDLIRYGYGELHRFFIVLAYRMGYTVAEVPVESLPRPNGTSKYGFERYARGAFDYLTVVFLSGYKDRPLHLLGGIGLSVMTVGAALFAYLGFEALALGHSMAGRPLLSIAVMCGIAGVQIFAVGLIAEMINNLERGNASRAKISRVVGIDRRNSTGPVPAEIRVERRKRTQLEPVDPIVVAAREAATEPVAEPVTHIAVEPSDSAEVAAT